MDLCVFTYLYRFWAFLKCQRKILVQESAAVGEAVDYDGVIFEIEVHQQFYQTLPYCDHLEAFPEETFHGGCVSQGNQSKNS